jgi:hypothetical protein
MGGLLEHGQMPPLTLLEDRSFVVDGNVTNHRATLFRDRTTLFSVVAAGMSRPLAIINNNGVIDRDMTPQLLL